MNDVETWLRSKRFVDQNGGLGIAWSGRLGYDFTDLEFRPTGTGKYADMWDAVIGHHASGKNPRMNIGVCSTLDEVKMVYEAIRLINGYPGPEDSPVDNQTA